MLKILQTRLQQYVNHELPDVQAGFRKGKGIRDQIANIHKIIKKAKWLSGEALQIAVKRREAKSKGVKERYKHLNAEFQRIARRDKKAFLSNQCKEIEENNRMGRPGAIAQSPGREAALAWASLAQRSPASSVLAREGAGCGSVGDVPGAWLASAPLSPSLWT